MRTTIRTTVLTVFVLATTLTAALAIGLQYYFGQAMAKDAALDVYTLSSSSIAARLHSIGTATDNIIDLLADNPSLPDADRRDEHLGSFVGVLQHNPLYYSVYFGRSDGSFFQVINLDSHEQARKKLRALPSDRWLIVTVNEGESERERQYQYLSEDLTPRLSRSEPTDYEVNTRPWYNDAKALDTIQRSDPYLFPQLGVPGRTISKRVADTDTVVAIDMTLSSISEFMQRHKLSEYGDVYLYDLDGKVIASSPNHLDDKADAPLPPLVITPAEKQYIESLPTLKVSNELNWPPFDYTQSGEPRGYSVDVITMIAEMTGLKVQFVNGYEWSELVSQFRNGDLDLLHSVILTPDNESWGLPGSSYAALPFALVTREGGAPLRGIAELKSSSLAIPTGWSIIPFIRERFPDLTIMEAESTLGALEQVLSGKVGAALDNEVIMRYIARHYYLDGLQYHSDIDLGIEPAPDELHIIVSDNQPRLRAIIDKAIAAIGPQQRKYLSDRWLNFESEAAVATSSTVPSNMLVKIAGDPELHKRLLETDIEGEPYLVYAAPSGEAGRRTPVAPSDVFVGILAPMDSVVGPFLSNVKLSIAITGAFLLLLLPLSWIFAHPIVRPIRLLATENDKVRMREYDKVVRVNSRVKELDELSVSMVNMVAAVQAHELAQRELMDSFIRLIGQAIDDKSTYTGGHCKRVPELALMLAEHASNSDLPAFREFCLEAEDQWREYRIAAWLHDCGKITTPEHIVDKGSKLETIYNRIHEVRMRFEVLWRDAEIDFLKKLADAPEDEPRLSLQLKNRRQQLQDDYAFVADCNVGGEFLDEDKQDRLRTIAGSTWQRFFDNRIGLSPVEELRVPSADCILPATEHLLSDKPEHIIERSQSMDFPPEFGINMQIPEHLYNLGEIYNLSVSRGTLTKEDRFKINEHMISTIKILESLPFPDELKNVPRYASTHHETMKGSGYPRRLSSEELSIPERILAIADVFEALTASDRPYKKAKPVSVAMDILYNMVLDNHLDRDCFELFVRDRVYLEYANRFLPGDQIDEVDMRKYLEGTA